ncbi:hypothetical protein KEJ48_06255, partial [Candidatus Bathyarchaeota archaeon]|nr:hypothetical protein [Candidatus Bathyarchaeota archaeon]
MRHVYDKPIYEIVTKGGYRVKVTGEHSIEIFNKDAYKFECKPARFLKPGDLVASCFKVPNIASINVINLASLILSEDKDLGEKIFVEGPSANDLMALILKKYPKNVIRREYSEVRRRKVKLSYFFKEGLIPDEGFIRLKYSNVNRLPLKIPVTGEFGRLLGYHVAEGNLNPNYCELTFGLNEREYVEDAVKCIREVFGLTPKLYRRPHKLTIIYGGRLLREIFERVFQIGNSAENKQVPFIMFNVNDYVKKEFIKGCFRGDKMINYHTNTRLTLKTVSRKLASDLIILLRQLGCVAYCWEVGDYQIVGVSETGNILDIVHELCNRSLNAKSRLLSIPAELVYNLRHEMRKAVPYGERTKLHKLLFTNGGRGRVGYERLKMAFQLMKESVINEKLRSLKTLVENGVVLLPIVKVKTIDNTKTIVYDVEVGEPHTFTGGLGALILHNSDIVKYKLPSDPLTKVDLKRLEELKRDPRYKDELWQKEIATFQRIKRKSEQEAFSRYGLTFIVSNYLPQRLKELNRR